MTEIVIFPCGAGEPTAHYEETVSPATRTVDLERHSDVLDADLLAELRSRYPDLKPALWGSIPAKRDVWQSVGLGDVAFFYRAGGLFAWGPITHTLRSPALAERLWGRNPDGDTWEYIYVLGAVHEPDPPIPFERLTTAAGYDMTHPLGTMVVRRGDNWATLRAVLGDGAIAPPMEDTSASARLPGGTDDAGPPSEGDQVEELEREAADLLANPRKGVGQGFITDVRRRRAIELHAVDEATKRFMDLGYTVQDVGATESYDLRCTRAEVELHVEVKGTTTSGGFVHLTKNEVLHAREYPDVALFVLTDVVVVGDGKEVRATGGVAHLYDPWEIQQGTLVATAYRYELPKP